MTTDAGDGNPAAMFSPQLPVTPHAAMRSPVLRETGGAGSSCAMYSYFAMWRAFQTAAA